MKHTLLAVILGILIALAPSLDAADRQAALAFDAPSGWVAKKPASSMRVAEFSLPRAEKDSEDASLVVYYFGGTGGSVQANLDRWIGQMQQPDGRDSRTVAKSATLTSKAGLKITLLDIPGTYIAEVTPGSSERFNKPGFRQLAAVVETKDGPYFVKVVGPAATVARWEPGVRAVLGSLRR